jgi:outer membrane protein OmpA-like peptidoglycan-associated protein
MKRTLGLGAIGLFLACAAQQKAATMVEYEEARGTDYARVVEERFPELYNEAQVHHAKAMEAHRSKDDAAMEHHGKVAMVWWTAARTNSEMVDLKQETANSEKELEDAKVELAAAQKRKNDADAAVARLEKIIALEGKLGDSEGMNKARTAINEALAAMKEAERVNAPVHAADEFRKAEAKFQVATTALEAGKAGDAQGAAIEAKKAADAAKAASEGKYKAEQGQLAYQQRRRALFDASADVPGAQRVITDGGVMITIREVFASAKVEVAPARYDTFNKIAKLAQEYDDFSIVVEGHTDTKGGASKNLQLSESRARSVMSYLTNQGVPPNRITALGKGQEQPVADNRTHAGRAQNRRIEILFAQGPAPK